MRRIEVERERDCEKIFGISKNGNNDNPTGLPTLHKKGQTKIVRVLSTISIQFALSVFLSCLQVAAEKIVLIVSSCFGPHLH